MSMIEVFPISSERRADFYRLHCDGNGTGLCNCIAWWVPTWEGWDERTAEENRALRDALFDRGEYDGYLLYADGEPAGWCQCGPRDRLAKLRDAFALAPDPDAWAISCFLIAPSHRGKGLMEHLLREVVADLQRRGICYVQGFPTRGEGLDAEEIWTGPESAFIKAGFRLEREGPRRPVYGLRLG